MVGFGGGETIETGYFSGAVGVGVGGEEVDFFKEPAGGREVC